MRFSQAGAIVALGSLSQAFLIPPTITSADNEHINLVPSADLVLDQHLMDIECLGCPIDIAALNGQTNSPTSGVHSIFRFNFSISHGDKDILLLNNHQIYPLDPMSQSFTGPLKADQLVEAADGTLKYVATPQLGFSLSAEHAVSSSKNEPSESEPFGIISIRLDIIEIDQVFVEKFPVIQIDLLETATEKLMIGELLLSTAQPLSSTPAQECKSTACKWRAFVASTISKLKGLKGSKGCGSGKKTPEIAHPDGSTLTHTPPKPFHGHHLPGHDGHRPHRHHHRHSRFAKFLRRLVFHVFIPIMIGVVVGVTASLVGMIVGHLAIFMWRILFRRGQSARCHRVHEESISKNDEDAKSLLGHGSPPPEYEDAPAYEVAVSDEKA